LTSAEGTIRAENVWKRFRPDLKSSQLKHSLKRGLVRLRRREPEWRWALRDMNLVTEPGDSTGIVGDNGSGKSTFLKILAGVMDPYAGNIEVHGRVGALIEVRGGIHGELTGRENIFLYGSLLGLRRAEITRRFDEIVAFGELEDALDRQVKFYSSGMGMRLGFSIAAFLEPDVLLVDEVLAVGDASFQHRCLAKMRDVLSNGTSLVYVSHDLASVEAICQRGIWLADGVVEADGPIAETLSFYRQEVERRAELEIVGDGPVQLLSIEVAGGDDPLPRTFEPLDVTLRFAVGAPRPGNVVLGISEGTANPMLSAGKRVEFRAGENEVGCRIERLPLPRGRFFLWVAVYFDGWPLLRWHPAVAIDVFGPDLPGLPPGITRQGRLVVDASWRATNDGNELAVGGPLRAVNPGRT
jgi:ABC-type polysaccharide/polyol phosphate transport system ATPase subunit